MKSYGVGRSGRRRIHHSLDDPTENIINQAIDHPHQHLDALRIQAEIETADRAVTKRPTWAPAVVLDGELLTLCRELEYLEPSDKPVAAGPGAIVKVLRAAGHAVVASDIKDYGFALQFRRDFLLETRAPADTACVLTYPPYRLANQFVARSLELVPRVLMLLRLAFLESQRRTPILESGALARINLFRERLPRMHRAGWNGPKASSSIAFAWFVFDRNHSGPTIVDRISARDVPDHGADR